MMRHTLAILAAMCLSAQAQTLNVREINVVADVMRNSEVAPVEWYQAESVRLRVDLRRNNAAMSVPDGVTPYWYAYRTNDLGTAYLAAAGAVNTEGADVYVALSPAQANLPTGVYVHIVQLWQGTNYMGVAASGRLTVRFAPSSTNVPYVGASAWPFVPRPTNSWASGYTLVSYDGGTTTAAIAVNGSGTLTNVLASGGLLTAGTTGATATVGLSTATVRTAIGYAAITGDVASAQATALAAITNVVLTEGDSNVVSVANRIATLTVRTNYTAGGGTSDLQLGIASTNAYAGSWGATVSNLAVQGVAAGNYASNALGGYVARTLTITNRSFMSTGGAVTVFSGVFGTYPYIWIGDLNGTFGTWTVNGAGGAQNHALYFDTNLNEYAVLRYSPLPRSTNVVISSGNWTNYITAGGQTPWASDINAATYSLTNLAAIGSASATNLSITIGTNTFFVRPY